MNLAVDNFDWKKLSTITAYYYPQLITQNEQFMTTHKNNLATSC